MKTAALEISLSEVYQPNSTGACRVKHIRTDRPRRVSPAPGAAWVANWRFSSRPKATWCLGPRSRPRSSGSERGLRRRVSLTVCDITKEQAVKAWAASVSEALGGGGPWSPDQQCGHTHSWAMEILPLDAIRHEFEVNDIRRLIRH